jgi:alpha-ketoglutarate-dependent taurine dioxygenase
MTTIADPTRIARPLTGTIGVELAGFDLRKPLTAEDVAAIRSAVLEYQVAFFPGQDLSLDEQVAFAGQLGKINPAHPVRGTAVGERLEIYRPATFVPGKAAPRWHADHTYMTKPSSLSILRAVRVPSSGGDTQWASLSAAYERLSPALQRLVDGLTAIHTPSPDFIGRIAKFGPGEWNGQPVTHLEPVEHPLVIVHPETGRRSLFINPASITSIVGIPKDQADALLQLLYEHAVRPEHVVRYRWTPGSLAVWDNRVTLHYPVADYDNADDREVNRVSLWGDAPVGVTGFVSRAVA